MKIDNNFVFLTSATAVTTSNELSNWQADQLTLEVSGTFTGATIKVLGKVDENTDFTELGTVNLSTFATGSSITSKGVYAVGITGISKIKVQLTAITSGSVTVFGRATL